MRIPRFRDLASLVLAFLLCLPGLLASQEGEAREQLEFGVKAAKKGLWREAQFRWEKALKLDPGDPRILNNLAVACEIAGDFGRAESLYKEALRRDPGSKDIKQNFDLFSSYYQTIRSRREKDAAQTAPAPPPPDETKQEKPPDAPPPR